MKFDDRGEYWRQQIELLRPAEIRAALAKRSLVYFPLGKIERHGEHLAVGLDGLTAHGICLHAAAVSGGLVYPPLYYGTGGGHGDYPWTVMMDSEAEIAALLGKTLQRLADFGVARAVIFSGHFAEGQLDMIDRIAAEWPAGAMQVLATSVNRAEGTAMPPDHAGRFETTLVHGRWPDRVDLAALSDAPEVVGIGRHDPASPIWGVIGADPRGSDLRESAALLRAINEWLAGFAQA